MLNLAFPLAALIAATVAILTLRAYGPRIRRALRGEGGWR